MGTRTSQGLDAEVNQGRYAGKSYAGLRVKTIRLVLFIPPYPPKALVGATIVEIENTSKNPG